MTCQNYHAPQNKRQGLLIMTLMIITTIVVITIPPMVVYAEDDLEDIQKEIEEKEEDYESTSKKLDSIKSQKDNIAQKIANLSSQLTVTDSEIKDLENDIQKLQSDLEVINKNLLDSNTALQDRIDLRNKVIRNYSKRNTENYLQMFLLKGNGLNGFQFNTLTYIFDKTFSDESIQLIQSINVEIDNFERDKKESEELKKQIEEEKTKLVNAKNALLAQKSSAQGELDNLQKQQSSFENELSKISATLDNLNKKQQEILKEKYGSEQETVGDNETDYSELPNPSFSPAYAFYTYGYPHRVGMSQYGAYGRAKAGQKYKDILKAYFNNVSVEEKWDDDDKIPVQGYGNIKMRDYLYGIAEVPESWADHGGYEALKAQAVAARTYALNYIYYTYDSKSGTIKEKSPVSICTTQACQVYNGGKKTGAWKKAVDETEGEVITYGGKPITSWFASTSGGYTRTAAQVWGSTRPWTKNMKDASCSGNLSDCAYEGPKYGNSPWFYKAWNSGYSAKNAWMKEEEVQDIINSYLLWDDDNDLIDKLSPPSKDGNAWDKEEVVEELEDRDINPVGNISSIKTYDDGNGYTTKIVVKSSNYSNLELDGYDFRSIFNLRSRESLYIYTSFFNIRVED